MDEKQKELAVRIAESVDSEDRRVLLAWAQDLQAIRNSSLPAKRKATKALKATWDKKVAVKAAKIIAREIKRYGWDTRGWKARGLIWGSAIGLAVFGGQGAGIAALGTAIGVPLWVVLGAGGLFIGQLIEVLQEETGSSRPKTEYTEIEGVKRLSTEKDIDENS